MSGHAVAVPTSEPRLPEAAERELEQRLAEGALELPLLPTTAIEVGRKAAEENPDPRLLAELIKRDQALATHLLRVVNSPLYAPRSPIVSLQQAVTRLGFAKIREVALLIAFRVGVFRAEGFEDDVKRVFCHAAAAALLAQETARATRRNVEDAFLSGLLHDVGRPVLLEAAADVLGKRAPEHAAAVLAFVERKHARAGALLARAWGLPAWLATTIEQHHAEAPTIEPAAVRLVQLADRMAHSVLAGTLDATELAAHPALAELELYPETLAQILAKGPAARAMAEAVA